MLLMIAAAAVMSVAAAWLRRRLTPISYTFATVPKPQRMPLILLVGGLFLCIATWHAITRNFLGLWSALVLGGIVFLFAASDFGCFVSAPLSEENGEPPVRL